MPVYSIVRPRAFDERGRRLPQPETEDEMKARLDAEGVKWRMVTVYGKPEVQAERYTGLVLADRERNGYHDSDFYAIVWGGSAPLEVEYATTRAACDGYHCTVDATPEVRAAYDAWRAERARVAREQAAEKALRAPAIGAVVRVVKGRKVKVGTEGTCFAVHDGQWGRRVGLVTAKGETHWTAVTNVVRPWDSPPESWVEAQRDELREQHYRELSLPKRGQTVVLKTTGKIGKVFWADKGRIGVRFSEARDTQGRWTDAEFLAGADAIALGRCVICLTNDSVAMVPEHLKIHGVTCPSCQKRVGDQAEEAQA